MNKSSSTSRVSFEASDAEKSVNDRVVEEPSAIRAVLVDVDARSCVEDQKKHLQQMVSKQRTSFHSLGCSVNNGSLRSLLSEKIDQNSSSAFFKNLDSDFTDETDDLTESFAGHNSQGRFQFDFDEEQKTLDFLGGDSEKDDDYRLPEPVPPSQKQIGSVEVTPGVFLSLRGAPETWQAIKYGCTIQTSCHQCNSDLHVIEDAAHVVCPDCWMIGPVEQSIGDIPLEFDGASDNHGLGLGVKASDLLKWLDSAEQSRSIPT